MKPATRTVRCLDRQASRAGRVVPLCECPVCRERRSPRHNPVRKALRPRHLQPRPCKGRSKHYDRAEAKRQGCDQ